MPNRRRRYTRASRARPQELTNTNDPRRRKPRGIDVDSFWNLRGTFVFAAGLVRAKCRARNNPASGPPSTICSRSLAAKEDAFLEREFLAPVMAGQTVRVRIGGVVCRIAVEPGDFAEPRNSVGWGVFQPTSTAAARLVRPATLSERREYLRLFPLLRLILCRRAGQTWLGSAASFGDHRLQLDGFAPVMLVEEVAAVRHDLLRATTAVAFGSTRSTRGTIPALPLTCADRWPHDCRRTNWPEKASLPNSARLMN